MNKIQKLEMWCKDMDALLEEANKKGIPLMVGEKKNSNGYIPKIQYWTNQLLHSTTPIEQAKALTKVNYFKKKHHTTYGVVVSMADMMLVDNLTK